MFLPAPKQPPIRPGPVDRLSSVLEAVGRLVDQQRAVLDALRGVPGLGGAPQPVPVPPPSSLPAPSALPYPPPATAYPAQPAVGYPPSVAPAAPAGLTVDEIRAVVADLLQRQQATVARSAARAAYLRDHLSDLPDAYRRLMPETDNLAALVEAEQSIRRQFRDDLRSARRSAGEAVATPVGGNIDGGEPPAAAVDYSRLSPLGQIELGLRSAAASSPAQAGPRPQPASPASPASDADPHADLFVGAD